MNGDPIGMAMFTFVGAVTPGPVNLLALRYGIGGGWARSMAYTLGASLSYGAVLWLSGTGARTVLADARMAQLIQWAGAFYLLYLAWRIMTAPALIELQAAGRAPLGAWSAFMQGGLCQVLNPKAWLVAMSGVAVFTSATSEGADTLNLFCTISVMGCAAGVGMWATAGRLVKDWLAHPRRQRVTNWMLGAILGLSVFAMLS